MNEFSTQTEEHYYQANLYEEIVKRLKFLGVEEGSVGRKDIAGVDEFHVRGAQVSKELAETVDIRGSKLLDVGCGIGGPCRMLADTYDCDVTGIDLSQEYIRTATKLTELVGLSSKSKFVQGDATDLPFKDEAFEVVWTQHVQMNIKDKVKFYSEINRVLAKGGVFLYYDILKKNDENISYPMPWASVPDISFLTNNSKLEDILLQLNFKRVKLKDETEEGILFFENMIENMSKSKPIKIGLNILMGDSTRTKISNLLKGLKNGKLMLQSGVYSK